MSDLSNRELEIKLAFLERHVEEQDRVVYRLREEVSKLRTELARLSDRIDAGNRPDSQRPADERPPHY